MIATGPAEVRAQRRLVELEGVIQGGLERFIEVGQALAEIRDSRLYRYSKGGDYATFEDYCRDRLQMGRNYTNKLIEATKVHAILGTNVPKPTAESQARELTPLLREQGPEAVREAWEAAVEATNGHPTAAAVRGVVDELKYADASRRIAYVSDARERERWGELGDVIKSLRAFTATDPVAVAHSVPNRRRQSTARALRDLGTYLGHIALELEHLEGSTP